MLAVIRHQSVVTLIVILKVMVRGWGWSLHVSRNCMHQLSAEFVTIDHKSHDYI